MLRFGCVAIQYEKHISVVRWLYDYDKAEIFLAKLQTSLALIGN